MVRGGSETLVLNMAAAMRERGHEVHLLCAAGGPVAASSPKVHSLPMLHRDGLLGRLLTQSPWFFGVDVESVSFFAQVVRREEAKALLRSMDVVSVHYHTDALLYSNLLKASGPPVVYHLAGWHVPPAIGWRRFRTWDRSAAYVANSAVTMALVSAECDLPFAGVVTPGIPRGFLTGLPARRPEPREPYRLAFVGRLVPNKGLEKLLEIAEGLRGMGRAVELEVIGEGPLRSHIARRAQARSLRVSLPGHVADPSGLLGGCDAFVFPSQVESFGMAVLEAMGCGLPVVASRIQTLEDLTGGTAVLVPPDADAAAWAGAILRVVEDGDLARAMVECGRRRARAFTWESKALEYEGILRTITDAAPLPGGSRL